MPASRLRLLLAAEQPTGAAVTFTAPIIRTLLGSRGGVRQGIPDAKLPPPHTPSSFDWRESWDLTLELAEAL